MTQWESFILVRRRRTPLHFNLVMSDAAVVPRYVYPENALPQTPFSSSPSRLPVERKAPIRARGAKELAPPRLRQPLGRPERLIRLAVCSHAGLPVDRPHLRLAVQGPAEEELARVVPVHRRDPCRVTCQVADVLTMLHVIEGNYRRVTSGGEP